MPIRRAVVRPHGFVSGRGKLPRPERRDMASFNQGTHDADNAISMTQTARRLADH